MSDISSDRIKELLSDPKNLDKIAAMVGSMSGGGLSALLGGSPAQKRPTLCQLQTLPQKISVRPNPAKRRTGSQNLSKVPHHRL